VEQKIIKEKNNANYWINISSLLPFILLMSSGIILQANYHFARKPDYYEVFSLNRSDWLLLHIIFALISTPIIIIHLALHFKWIKNLFKNKFSSKGNKIVRTSKILLVLYFFTVITGLVPWIFIEDPHGKRMLIELHDKITLGIIIYFILHFIQHFKWLVKNTKNIFKGKDMLFFLPRFRHPRPNHLETKFVRLNTGICQACWKCLEKCPQKAIGKIDLPFHKHARINNSEKCTGCLKCIKVCEFNALQKIVVS
jgi:ferredoxin